MTIERLVTSDFMAPSNKFTWSGQGLRQSAACAGFSGADAALHRRRKRPNPPQKILTGALQRRDPTHPTNPMQRLAEVASNSNMLERWRAAHHAHTADGVGLA